MLLFADKTREEFEERVRDLNDTILNLEQELQKKVHLAVSEQLLDTEQTTETKAKATGEEGNWCKQDSGNEDQVFGVHCVRYFWIRIRSSRSHMFFRIGFL